MSLGSRSPDHFKNHLPSFERFHIDLNLCKVDARPFPKFPPLLTSQISPRCCWGIVDPDLQPESGSAESDEHCQTREPGDPTPLGP